MPKEGKMNLELITFAETFYASKGYQRIEVPWAVDKDVLEITLPKNKKGVDLLSRKLVGSAEQSYLQMIKKKQLNPGRYVTTTPCFRDDNEDELHQHYFLKTELINFSLENKISQSDLGTMMGHALKFFGFFLPVKTLQTGIGYDIVDQKFGIELGSYGIRSHKFAEGFNVQWAYGTAIALPRLTYILERTRKKGYHDRIIPKVPVGSFLKILEETEEAQDAYLSENKVMLLVELADIYGAMELFLEKDFHGISMGDIKKMNEVTKRAFQNGRR